MAGFLIPLEHRAAGRRPAMADARVLRYRPPRLQTAGFGDMRLNLETQDDLQPPINADSDFRRGIESDTQRHVCDFASS